jgi:signal transduction histidine kinase
MRVGQHVVGVLALDHGGEAHLYTPEEQALARAVARLIGLVIERERLLREREAARAKARALREANRRMEEFLGLASHELRTPLTSIRGSLQIMQRRLDRALEAEDRRDAADAALGRLSPLLDRAIAQTGVLNSLVGDLLDVSLIQAGQLRLHLAPLDLLGLVRQVVEDQRELALGRAITLELPPLAGLTVRADAERLAQVLTNYLDNALKYSTEDQPVSVGVEVEASTARVWVRDGGPGVKAADQRRIWERFHRVEGVGHRFGSSVGLGLGLYISRTIVERHQGQVGVESAPGAGATFWFTLPLSR